MNWFFRIILSFSLLLLLIVLISIIAIKTDDSHLYHYKVYCGGSTREFLSIKVNEYFTLQKISTSTGIEVFTIGRSSYSEKNRPWNSIEEVLLTEIKWIDKNESDIIFGLGYTVDIPNFNFRNITESENSLSSCNSKVKLVSLNSYPRGDKERFFIIEGSQLKLFSTIDSLKEVVDITQINMVLSLDKFDKFE